MIRIISENEFFLVVDKPHGVSTHNESPSVAEFLKLHDRPEHFVNRLDAETSGLMLIAKRAELHEPLRQSLDAGTKTYHALLRGSLDLEAGATSEWNWPVSDKAEGRRNPQGEPHARVQAKSIVELVQKNKYFSEVKFTLVTGRQHQLRKHAAIAKHPIVGDKRYNDDKYNQRIRELYETSRLYLAATRLIFEFSGHRFAHNSAPLELANFFK